MDLKITEMLISNNYHGAGNSDRYYKWQIGFWYLGIDFYYEFDGKRDKHALIKINGE